MQKNIFFKKKNIKIGTIYSKKNIKKNFLINDIKSLEKAKINDVTFLDSSKYALAARKTKGSLCITTKKLKNLVPDSIEKLIVDNVLLELAKLIKKIYPSADIDYPDLSLQKPDVKKYKSVKFGNNVLVGRNVKLGKNTIIGSNTIIEQNVIIGKDCVVGSNVIVKNTLLGNRVVLQDNCKIGQKGFGFIPINNMNIKFPHIGKVFIDDDVEIASGCTIDRGSVDDTIIGKNTYLDNQVHVAHNVKIGKNCMIAGQVGFAGSSTIGNNV